MTVLPEKPSSVSPAGMTSLKGGEMGFACGECLADRGCVVRLHLSNPDSSSVLEAGSSAPWRGQSRGHALPGYAHQVCPW